MKILEKYTIVYRDDGGKGMTFAANPHHKYIKTSNLTKTLEDEFFDGY